MDGREFLSLAHALAAGSTAAHRRSALSRAYYAVYHTASELLLGLGIALPRDHRGHEWVRQCLQHSNDASLIEAGAILHRLQNIRVKADYDLRDPHPERPGTVAFYLSRAQQGIGLLERVAAADPARRDKIKAAIQTGPRQGSTNS
jgi:uncharacterized protein (UPF0332 family)